MAILLGSLALVMVVVWLKIRQAEQNKDEAQEQRIREQVERSIRESLAKQKADK